MSCTNMCVHIKLEILNTSPLLCELCCTRILSQLNTYAAKLVTFESMQL